MILHLGQVTFSAINGLPEKESLIESTGGAFCTETYIILFVVLSAKDQILKVSASKIRNEI